MVEIAGFGSAHDAHAINNSAPACDGARAAIRQALHVAAIEPAQVACITASASGSREADAMEARALHQVFGDALSTIPICAPKAGFGEAIGSSGALCAVASLTPNARRHASRPLANERDRHSRHLRLLEPLRNAGFPPQRPATRGTDPAARQRLASRRNSRRA
jgi:hypothetical protein